MRWVVVFVVLPFFAYCQASYNAASPERADFYLASFHQVSNEPVKADPRFNKLIARYASRSNSTDELKSIFSRTHHVFLKHFKPFSTFGEIFTKGNYNCLTATALYGIILQEAGYAYKIIETNYHIFLLVETTNSQALIETTDELFGFVTNKAEIELRLEEYRSEANKSTAQHTYTTALFNTVTLHNLIGLLHFNEAVKSINNSDYLNAIDHLAYSTAYYGTTRSQEFAAIVLHELAASNLQYSVKKQYVQKLRNVQSKTNLVAQAGQLKL